MGMTAYDALEFLPLLVLVAALVVVLVKRSKLPRRLGFAAAGFGVLIVGALGSDSWNLASNQMIRHHAVGFSVINAVNYVVWVIWLLFYAGGFALILVGLLRSDAAAPVQPAGTPPPQPGAVPPPQYPGQQYPGPQYPGPQYPGQQYPGPPPR